MSTPGGSKGSGPPLFPSTQPQLSGGVPRPLELASTGAQEDGSRLQAAYNVIIKGLSCLVLIVNGVLQIRRR